MQTTDIQSIIQSGLKKHGYKFRNYLENFPKFNYEDLGFNITIPDLQFYEDTFGNLTLRKKLSIKESKKYNYEFNYNNFILTNGVTHGLYLCLSSLKLKGYTRVIIPSPSYSGYKDICEALDLEYISYDMNQGFLDDMFDDFTPSISDILIINSPHNPTGSCLCNENLDQIEMNIKEKGISVVFDCIYDQLIFEESMIIDWSSFLSKKIFQNCYFVNSFSKNLGLPGLRLGWILSNEVNISKIEPILERNIICMNSVSQKIALKILSRKNNKHFKQELLERRNYLCSELSKTDSLKFMKPNAGTTIIVKVNNIKVSKIIDHLIDKGIGILPGYAYYGGKEDTFRLSYGYTYEEMDDIVLELRKTVEILERETNVYPNQLK